MPSPNEILAELKKVKYPGFTRDIVSFGIIKDIEVAYAGVTVSLTMASAKPEVVEKLYTVQLAREEDVERLEQKRRAAPMVMSHGGEAAAAKTETVRREGAKVGRNDPCVCGSGKKYKKCCGTAATR